MIVKSILKNNDFKKGLYLISTPIGNLKDITFRAIETLKLSDYILCEDTRVSQKLLKNFKINAELISNHKFNEKKNVIKIIKLLKQGSIISLISDAGSPGISDPGRIIVNECVKNNIYVTSLPGPSAVTTAISISGFSDKFFSYGFLPEKKNEIIRTLELLSNLDSSIVFFISSKKFNKIIPFLRLNFEKRKMVICREMSKIYEEFIRTDIDELKPFENGLRGELTIVISDKIIKKNSQELSESDKRNIKKMINKLSIKEIVSFINRKKNISKKKIYNYCLSLKDEN